MQPFAFRRFASCDDAQFAAHYTCALGPAAAPPYRGLVRLREAGAPALLVELETGDGVQYLELGGSTLVRAGVTGWYPTPCPSSVFVVANGRGYWIDTRAKRAPEICPLEPIYAVHGLAGPALLVVASPWQVAAYDEGGLRWTSARLAIEGLRVVCADAESIDIEEALGDGTWRRRRIDVLTGKVTSA